MISKVLRAVKVAWGVFVYLVLTEYKKEINVCVLALLLRSCSSFGLN